MENLKIHISPTKLSYRSSKAVAFILKYKRILINTNHELQKYEGKQKVTLEEGVAEMKDKQVGILLQMSKEFQLMNTKIEIIIVQCAERQGNSWRNMIKLLGICTLDLGRLADECSKVSPRKPIKLQSQLKLEKCENNNSFLGIDIKIEKISTYKVNSKKKQFENNILKTQSYYKENLLLQRRPKKDVPTAYEISHRNYKQAEVSRFQNSDKSKESRSSVGSYRKRFEYQEAKNKRKKVKDNLKIISKKRKNEEDSAPIPRLKTPEPISSFQKNSSKPKPKKNIRYQPDKVIQKNEEQKSSYGIVSSEISQMKHSGEDIVERQENYSSMNIQSFKQNKYKMITEKLEAIQQKISQRKYDTPSSDFMFDEAVNQSQNLEEPYSKQFHEVTPDLSKEIQQPKKETVSSPPFSEEKVIESENINYKKLLEKQNQQRKEELIKKEQIIKKLTKLYQEADFRSFEITKDYEKKVLEYERKMDGLLKRNYTLEEELEKVKNQKSSRKQSEKAYNYYEDYISQKKKIVNLEYDIRCKENQIKFLKIKNENIEQEKKDLENEIEIIITDNKKQLARKGSISKINLENQSVSASVKVQNKALKQEINSLQKQVHELNYILEGLIEQKRAFDQSSQAEFKQKEFDQNWVILNRKYQILQQQVEAYEEEVNAKKLKIADMINIIWRHGNPKLIEEIDSSMGIQ